MKRILVYMLFLSVFFNSSFCQETNETVRSVKNFSLELLGNGIVYSVKFENWIQKNTNFRYNIGVSVVPKWLGVTEDQDFYAILPEILYLIGNKRSKIEIGAGLMYGIVMHQDKYDYVDQFNYKEKTHTAQLLFLNARLGYRYEGIKNIFRFDFVPLYFVLEKWNSGETTNYHFVYPWLGLSYGRKI